MSQTPSQNTGDKSDEIRPERFAWSPDDLETTPPAKGDKTEAEYKDAAFPSTEDADTE